MPIYEYVCDDCGTKFEKLVRRGADGVGLACPSCGQVHLTQQLSVFSTHAGSGPSRDLPSCAGGMCRTPDLCGRN